MRNVLTLLLTVLSLISSAAAIAEPPQKVDRAVAHAAANNPFVDVVVTMVPDRAPKPFARPNRVRNEEGRAWVRSVMADFTGRGASKVADLGNGAIFSRIPTHAYEPISALLEHNPRVESVRLAPELTPFTLEGFDAVGIHQIANGGAYFPSFGAGALGEEVVIIDAAFDLDHPAFAGASNINAYCACGRVVNGSTIPCCPNGQAFQAGTAMAASFPLPGQPQIADFHGTSVASVVRTIPGLTVPVTNLGGVVPLPPTLPGPTIHGAANNVTLHLINVQDRSSFNGWSGSQPKYSFPGVIEALTQVLNWTYIPGRRIRAVNMSFGNVPQPCETDPMLGPMQLLINQLTDRGVMVVAASGNGTNPRTVVPGCIPNVVTVASAEHPSRRVKRACHNANLGPPWMSCYATFDENVDIIAPTEMRIPVTQVNPQEKNYQTLRNLANRSGTSFAAPIVAACAAQMASAWPGWNVASATTAMKFSPLLAWRCDPSNPQCSTLQRSPYLQCLSALQIANTNGAYLNVDRVGLSGTYYDPSTEGQGFLVDVTQNLTPTSSFIFASWFTYTSPAQPGGQGLRWYTMTGAFPNGATQAQVQIYQSTFANTPTFGQMLVNHSPVTIGTGIWKFRSCNQAEFSYTSEELGAPTSNGLRRIIVSRDGATPRCTESPSIDPPISDKGEGSCVPRYPDALTGVWQRATAPFGIPDPAHDGRGFVLDFNSGNSCNGGGVFGAWYDYAGPGDSSGVADRFRWFTFSLFGNPDPVNPPPANDFCLNFTISHGGARLSPYPDSQWNNFPPQAPQQCPIRLTFQDCNHGILAYNIGTANLPGFEGILGTSGTFPIARSLPVAGCALP